MHERRLGMNYDVSPRTALVTGATQGIGRSPTELLLSRGYVVHGTFNSSSAQAEIMANKHPALHMHKADFRRPSAVDELLAAIQGVDFDALVNNAGIFEMDGFDNLDVDSWRAVLEVNLTAPVRL